MKRLRQRMWWWWMKRQVGKIGKYLQGISGYSAWEPIIITPPLISTVAPALALAGGVHTEPMSKEAIARSVLEQRREQARVWSPDNTHTIPLMAYDGQPLRPIKGYLHSENVTTAMVQRGVERGNQKRAARRTVQLVPIQ